MKPQWVGVLDCNNFFVSCERLFRPDLIGKPVIVLSSNDGCVVARSQEIKDMGIPMGVPYFQVKDTLKKARTTTFSSHFALYRDISRRVFDVMRQELEIVEQYSIDEAFFVTQADPQQVAERLKRAVETQVGIPVSVGVAHSKTQAKYANSVAKKSGGVCVLDDQAWVQRTSTIPLASIWGVGRRLELQYTRHNLHSVADLLAADPASVRQLFGVVGVRLQQELCGRAIFPVDDYCMPQKSIMSSRSFRETTTDVSVLQDALAYHVRHVLADLRAMGLQTTQVRVMILPSRHGDFLLRGGSALIVLSKPTADTPTLLREVMQALSRLYEAGVPYKKAGVVLSHFTSVNNEQGTLFDATPAPDTQSLMSVIDAVNIKSGKELLRIGSRLQAGRWQSRKDQCSPAYTTRWEQVVTVVAK